MVEASGKSTQNHILLTTRLELFSHNSTAIVEGKSRNDQIWWGHNSAAIIDEWTRVTEDGEGEGCEGFFFQSCSSVVCKS